MSRFFISIIIGLVIGAILGLFLGWVQFPVEFVNSPASSLTTRYKDEYTVMIANGYRGDSDVQGAIERLRILGIENVPVYVQETAERYITNSRVVEDIVALVALSNALGRLTPIMEPYLEIVAPEGQ
ncbi:MAG: hypothetical protein RLP44_29790 [Aggregatilineales bacterium]